MASLKVKDSHVTFHNTLPSNYILRFIIVVEHDLSVLDYLSDFICCLYGVPGAYGVVTMPFSVREGNAKSVEITPNPSNFVHLKKWDV